MGNDQLINIIFYFPNAGFLGDGTSGLCQLLHVSMREVNTIVLADDAKAVSSMA